MIKYVEGNIFQSPSKVLVNTVNTQGVMGKGIALNFKKLYPEMFILYQKFCDNKQLEIGKLWLYKTPNKWILNFPTKKEWRKKSQLSYIEEGLKKFVSSYKDKNITSISFPKLGCGNGGLDWAEVQPLMEKYLNNLPIDIYIYVGEYSCDREFENLDTIKSWINSNAYDIPFTEFVSDISNMKDFNSTINQDELRDFWNALRNSKIITNDNIYFENDQTFRQVYTCCTNLDYIKKCAVHKDGIRYEGLQLIPSQKNYQYELGSFI